MVGRRPRAEDDVLKLLATSIALALLIPTLFLKQAQPKPERTQRILTAPVLAVAIVASLNEVAAYPAALPIPPEIVAAVLIAVATLAPLLGLLEHLAFKARKGMHEPFKPDRFAGHLLTNLIGAAIAIGLLWLARDAGGVATTDKVFSNDFLFNVFLPFSLVIALAIIRGQQADTCPELDTSKGEVDESCYYEQSLNRWHQVANFLHLTLVVYVSTTTLLYLLGVTMRAAHRGQPLEFHASTGIVAALGLVFVLVCGLPFIAKDRPVFFTFATGTPAVLCAVSFWFAMFRPSSDRDLWTYVIVIGGYIIYVALMALDQYRSGKTGFHFFGALAVAGVLSTLLAGMYAGF